jgi:hypothetical protein
MRAGPRGRFAPEERCAGRGSKAHVDAPHAEFRLFRRRGSVPCHNGRAAPRPVPVWRWDAGKLTLLDSGEGAVFPAVFFYTVTVNADGAVWFEAITWPTSTESYETIIESTASGLHKIAPDKPPVEGGGPYYYATTLLNDGSAVYYANGTGEEGRAIDGKLETVNPGYSDCATTPSSQNGLVAYLGFPSDASIDCAYPTNFYLTDALTRKTRNIVFSSGLPCSVIVENMIANNSGDITFSCRGSGGNGLYLLPAGSTSPKLLYWSATYGYDWQLSISNTGAVVATVALPDGYQGVALSGDVVNGRIAWPGDTINGCQVATTLALGSYSINSKGQVVLQLTCGNDGGYLLQVLATPKSG